MNVLSWNCQGLGNKATIGYLRDLWGKHRPDFLFLSETKQSRFFMEQFLGHFGYSNCVTVDPIGCSGGLALFFNNNMFPVTILFQSNRIIDIETVYKGKTINLSFVYGDPVPKKRDQVWERLTRMSLSRNSPWFAVGDFNELTGNHEKRGGALRHASTFVSFNLMIRNCGFLHFPYVGNWLSWRGWRGGKNKKPIRCRLDRALGNEDWHELFPDTVVKYLPMVGSDHKPILTTIAEKSPRGRRMFMFDKRWIGKEGLSEAITKGWEAATNDSNSGFVDKIISCRKEISKWRAALVPHGRDKIEKIKAELARAQADDSCPPEVIAELTSQLREAYCEEETYWHQKSRTKWMHCGDKNTKFFHAQTKQRRARNRIVGLFDKSDKWSMEEKDIQKIAVSYFDELFTTSEPHGFEEALAEVSMVITEDVNVFLTAPATELEIKAALFMMHPDKAPGPDGMTALFYQKAWTSIKKDLVTLVNSFFEEGIFDPRLNRTNICLIPKIEKATRMIELRPISLCNVGYKVISKVLCQRLKTVLPRIISETQSAFVQGRLISDNILIAQEMFHGLRTNQSCKSKFLAIKTDMSKAYDRVEWIFIDKLLRKMGFCDKWTSWIMKCITTVEYKVLLNGQPRGAIMPERGLRQGDPLSPYLFILCTEVLIANIRKAEQDKLITGIKVANKSPPISHLLFADDSLFFCKANKEQCGVILGILRQYEEVSGQQINFAKSSIQFGHKVDETIKSEIKGALGISKIGGMGSYLGLPESMGGSKTQIFSFVKDRLQNRINGWTAKFLSKGGKEVMIKSVAAALPTYVMSCFRLPKSVTSKLTSAVADFWWSTSGDSKGMHWKAWDKLCSSKQLGGLGFRNVDDFNTALLAKQLWRLMEVPDSLFAKVLKGRYYRNSNPLENIKSYSPSYGWRSIVSARSLVQKGLIKRVGSGESISVWKDPWIPAQFPRPAKSNGSFMDPSLQIHHLIDHGTRSWDLDKLSAIFEPTDVALISALPLGHNLIQDTIGWHFTKNGQYSVKSGYHTVRLPNLIPAPSPIYGPDCIPLQAHVWKLKCPPKIQHFIWQALTGCISVLVNLHNRGINCDVICARCGIGEETINHVLFECPPARQVWALSQVPSGPQFPSASLFTNLDYLFWRQAKQDVSDSFPWILWYIWKARNAKIFENKDEKPLEIVRLANSEFQAWQKAQVEEEDTVPNPLVRHPRSLPQSNPLRSSFSGLRCYVDGSWKETDNFTGYGWHCTSSDSASTMGAANRRRSLSPLHAELEALMWAMRCMIGAGNLHVTFLTDCSDMVKMVSSPTEWPAFAVYLEDIASDREEFLSFSLSLIKRSENVQADKLARNVRVLPQCVTFVNHIPPNWLA